MKVAGALWLLWLGATLIRSGMKARQSVLPEATEPVSLQGAWTANILNPKAIIFYLTVVSQFAGQQGGISHYLMLASVHVMVMSFWLVAVSQVLIFSAKKTNTLVLKKSLILQAVYCLSLRPCTVSSADRPVRVIRSPRCLLSHDTGVPARKESPQARTSYPATAGIPYYVTGTRSSLIGSKGFRKKCLSPVLGGV